MRHLLSRPDPAGKAGEGKQLLHARTRKGETVLMAAAKSGGPERATVVAELLKAGADVSQVMIVPLSLSLRGPDDSAALCRRTGLLA